MHNSSQMTPIPKMASLERFTLRWDDFQANARVALKEFREEGEFFDVTLVAGDGKQVQANKVVLAGGSAFFHKILKEHPHQRPLIYLQGVGYKHLAYLTDFMYTGVAMVANEDINDFLLIAEDLKIKGLTGKDAPKNPEVDNTKDYNDSASYSGKNLPHPTSMENPDLTGHVKVEVSDTDDFSDSSSHPVIYPPSFASENCDRTSKVKFEIEVGNANDYNISHGINDQGEAYKQHVRNEELIHDRYTQGEDNEESTYDWYDQGEGQKDYGMLLDKEQNHNDSKLSPKMFYEMYIQTDNKEFQCLTCDKLFSKLKVLKAHIKIHTEERRHQCLTCGKKFFRLSNLNQHNRIHTGEKPFQCVTCDKKFSHAKSLYNHTGVHTREKYECLTCHKKFSRQDTLTKHMRSHTG